MGLPPPMHPNAPPPEPSLRSLAKHLMRLEIRLYHIEDKIDHLLYHAMHDVTAQVPAMTPLGILPIPATRNPQSHHNVYKSQDILRTMSTLASIARSRNGPPGPGGPGQNPQNRSYA